MTGVRQASKHEVVMALRERYWAASRAERGQVLDTVVEATGYHRKYALTLLRHGVTAARPRLVRRGRPRTDGLHVIAALQAAGGATGWVGGNVLGACL